MEFFQSILSDIDDFVWGVPLIVLILATGIYLTIRVGAVQIRHLPLALKYMVKNEEGGTGEVSSFGALCTAMSATIGTGNIVGVATALVAGGPGALFWMWVAALFGMATKYSEGLLAIKYRKIDEDGHVLGGPFYYILDGLGEKVRRFKHAGTSKTFGVIVKILAILFAIFGACVGLLGIGTFTQVNSISSAAQSFFDPNMQNTVTIFGMEYSWSVIITGLLVTLASALVIIGGLKRIAKISTVVVPFMAIFYVVACLVILFCNIQQLPGAFMSIIRGAFGLDAMAGGAMGAIIVAMQRGISRGIFSNEAGLGSAPIAAAAAKTNEPVRQGLVSMTGTFVDTIIICTMTGLTIIMMGSHNIGLDGVDVTINAFTQGLPFSESIASLCLTLCLIFFGFTTILGWNYYGERCVDFLFKGKQAAILTYRWLYILAIFIAPYMTLEAVWTIADIFNGLMSLPNLIALIFLSGVIAKETKSYFDRLNHRTLR